MQKASVDVLNVEKTIKENLKALKEGAKSAVLTQNEKEEIRKEILEIQTLAESIKEKFEG